MRIVLLLTVGLERPSGRRYRQVARHLVQAGQQVRILALHPDYAACRQRRFVEDGVEVWYVGQMHARKQGSRPQRFSRTGLLRVLVTATLGMVWGVLCSPADVYHLGKPQPINGLATLMGVCLLRGQRFYVDCDDDETASNRFSAGWQRAVFAGWQWLLPRLAAGATVNTRFLQARLQGACWRWGRGPVVYVPNGVAPDGFRPPAPGVLRALRQALGLEGRRVIAYVGTLACHNHPVDLLLVAFARLAADVPDSVLLLVGGGEDLVPLRAQAAAAGLQQRVRFTGHVPHRATRAYLALADLSVDPVCDNAVARARSPLKIFESLALGVPVVTGDVGDRAALLAYGQAGVLVRPGDAASLAAGITALLTDAPRRARLAAVGRLYARQFAWARLAAAWQRVYDQEAL